MEINIIPRRKISQRKIVARFKILKLHLRFIRFWILTRKNIITIINFTLKQKNKHVLKFEMLKRKIKRKITVGSL